MGLKLVPWTKSKQKYLTSLRSTKFRKIHNRFIVEGSKIVSEMLRLDHSLIECIICTEDWLSQDDFIESLDIEVSVLKSAEMKALSAFKTSPKAILIAKKSLKSINEVIKPVFRAVYLDDVQDPGNVGSIIRTASWFGFDAVIRSSGSADFYNSKVVQSSMGGFNHLSLVSENIKTIKEAFPEIRLIGTSLTASTIYSEFNPGQQYVMIIGHEGKGMTEDTRAVLDDAIYIPGSNKIESLNAAVAFGIVAGSFAQRG